MVYKAAKPIIGKASFSNFDFCASFKVVLSQTIESEETSQNQDQQQEINRENAVRELTQNDFAFIFEHAYLKSIQRSGADNTSGYLQNHKQWRLCGLFITKQQFERLNDHCQQIVSKLRRFVMEELIAATGLKEYQICNLLDITINKLNKNYVIWNKKYSYTKSLKYRQMLKKEQLENDKRAHQTKQAKILKRQIQYY